ncbi:hypothetical protein SAMN05428945_5310 [Streptomyces sp. 2224.1]|nr:hypothetical protein SAMN05428945_5310 [Streptomyces sp. 2224.1]
MAAGAQVKLWQPKWEAYKNHGKRYIAATVRYETSRRSNVRKICVSISKDKVFGGDERVVHDCFPVSSREAGELYSRPAGCDPFAVRYGVWVEAFDKRNRTVDYRTTSPHTPC